MLPRAVARSGAPPSPSCAACTESPLEERKGEGEERKGKERKGKRREETMKLRAYSNQSVHSPRLALQSIGICRQWALLWALESAT